MDANAQLGLFVAAAAADGQITPEETRFLKAWASENDLAASEVDEAVAKVAAGERRVEMPSPESDEERLELLRTLVEVTVADEVVKTAERGFIDKVAKALGIARKDVNKVVNAAVAASGAKKEARPRSAVAGAVRGRSVADRYSGANGRTLLGWIGGCILAYVWNGFFGFIVLASVVPMGLTGGAANMVVFVGLTVVAAAGTALAVFAMTSSKVRRPSLGSGAVMTPFSVVCAIAVVLWLAFDPFNERRSPIPLLVWAGGIAATMPVMIFIGLGMARSPRLDS